METKQKQLLIIAFVVRDDKHRVWLAANASVLAVAGRRRQPSSSFIRLSLSPSFTLHYTTGTCLRSVHWQCYSDLGRGSPFAPPSWPRFSFLFPSRQFSVCIVPGMRCSLATAVGCWSFSE